MDPTNRTLRYYDSLGTIKEKEARRWNRYQNIGEDRDLEH
jgi:DNA-binding transcriptional MerR regulator